VRLVVVDPSTDAARSALRSYLEEIGTRFGGVRDPEPALADAVAAYAPPSGLFVVVEDEEGAVHGCGALRWMDDERAEVKRMWISPTQRGKGLGATLLGCLEDLARAAGRTTLLLDTNGALTEAIALYDRHGFERIERYNDNPRAELWFRKAL
jgi:GNAT superfamily N-acetyltransferase